MVAQVIGKSTLKSVLSSYDAFVKVLSVLGYANASLVADAIIESESPVVALDDLFFGLQAVKTPENRADIFFNKVLPISEVNLIQDILDIFIESGADLEAIITAVRHIQVAKLSLQDCKEDLIASDDLEALAELWKILKLKNFLTPEIRKATIKNPKLRDIIKSTAYQITHTKEIIEALIKHPDPKGLGWALFTFDRKGLLTPEIRKAIIACAKPAELVEVLDLDQNNLNYNYLCASLAFYRDEKSQNCPPFNEPLQKPEDRQEHIANLEKIHYPFAYYLLALHHLGELQGVDVHSKISYEDANNYFAKIPEESAWYVCAQEAILRVRMGHDLEKEDQEANTIDCIKLATSILEKQPTNKLATFYLNSFFENDGFGGDKALLTKKVLESVRHTHDKRFQHAYDKRYAATHALIKHTQRHAFMGQAEVGKTSVIDADPEAMKSDAEAKHYAVPKN